LKAAGLLADRRGVLLGRALSFLLVDFGILELMTECQRLSLGVVQEGITHLLLQEGVLVAHAGQEGVERFEVGEGLELVWANVGQALSQSSVA
jgi:hypothetical protein